MRLTMREENALKFLQKAIKLYHYERTHSRSDPAPEPSRKQRHLFSTSETVLPVEHVMAGGDDEFWKLDPTESPIRVRRLLKKNFNGNELVQERRNFSAGSPLADPNAVTGLGGRSESVVSIPAAKLVCLLVFPDSPGWCRAPHFRK